MNFYAWHNARVVIRVYFGTNAIQTQSCFINWFNWNLYANAKGFCHVDPIFICLITGELSHEQLLIPSKRMRNKSRRNIKRSLRYQKTSFELLLYLQSAQLSFRNETAKRLIKFNFHASKSWSKEITIPRKTVIKGINRPTHKIPLTHKIIRKISYLLDRLPFEKWKISSWKVFMDTPARRKGTSEKTL